MKNNEDVFISKDVIKVYETIKLTITQFQKQRLAYKDVTTDLLSLLQYK